MKGKTGKMKGGGMARKGVGAALKGGGMARKGTGSKSTPGGKVAKMAMGGTPPMTTMPVPPPRGQMRPLPVPPPAMGGGISSKVGPGMGGPMTRPGFPSRRPMGGMGEAVRPQMPGRANLKSGGKVKAKSKNGK